MRPNFQMKDENKKIVYDSKDYVCLLYTSDAADE